jgi:hypothetical protein
VPADWVISVADAGRLQPVAGGGRPAGSSGLGPSCLGRAALALGGVSAGSCAARRVSAARWRCCRVLRPVDEHVASRCSVYPPPLPFYPPPSPPALPHRIMSSPPSPPPPSPSLVLSYSLYPLVQCSNPLTLFTILLCPCGIFVSTCPPTHRALSYTVVLGL